MDRKKAKNNPFWETTAAENQDKPFHHPLASSHNCAAAHSGRVLRTERLMGEAQRRKHDIVSGELAIYARCEVAVQYLQVWMTACDLSGERTNAVT